MWGLPVDLEESIDLFMVVATHTHIHAILTLPF